MSLCQQNVHGLFCDRPAYLNGFCLEHSFKLKINLPQVLLSRRRLRTRRRGKLKITITKVLR